MHWALLCPPGSLSASWLQMFFWYCPPLPLTNDSPSVWALLPLGIWLTTGSTRPVSPPFPSRCPPNSLQQFPCPLLTTHAPLSPSTWVPRTVTHDQWTPASGLHSLSLGFLILKMRTVILPTSWGCQGTSEATRGCQHCSWYWLALLQHWYNNNYYHVIIFMFLPLFWSAALEFFIWVSGPHYASIIISYRNQQVSGWKSHSGLHEFKDMDQPYFLATFLF